MVTKYKKTIGKQIEEKLKYAFSPIYLLVLDESNQHHLSQGKKSHFNITLVTEKFKAQKMLARHQDVYQLLADELTNSVHALVLRTYTPAEWQQRQQIAFSSPICRSKRIGSQG